MKRPTCIPIGMPQRAIRLMLAAILTFGILVPWQIAMPRIAYAETTGSASPYITIYYGTGNTVSGQWQEGILTVGGKKAYCVEVDTDFKSGMSVTSVDPVAKGIWSQEVCTKLALIDEFVTSGEFVSTSGGTGTGKKVTDPNQQYAVAQCYIWKCLNDAGYDKNHYGWFGASMTNGPDLTGSDTDKQVNDYVSKNLSSYVGSAKYYDCGSSQSVACEFSLSPAKGHISLAKRSANEKLTSGNASYSLQNAEYGIYSNKSCGKDSLVETLKTDKSGNAKSSALESGSYFVKESVASAGFQVDDQVYPVTVQAGKEAQVNATAGFVSEEPDSGTVELRKNSANASISDGNDSYSLKGALYGIYEDSDCKNLVAKMTTSASGIASANGISLGKKYVREITAPQGYAIDSTTYPIVVSSGKTVVVNGGYVSDVPKNCPIDLLMQKYDSEKDDPENSGIPQGGASLANAEFRIEHYPGMFDTPEQAAESGEPDRTWMFKTDAEGKILLDEAHLASGDALFLATDNTPCMPLGTIVITETIPPAGYIASTEAICIQIADDGSAGESVDTFKQPFMPNQVIRGDFEFVKYSDDEENKLAGIPFAITSQTTGETHVIVTDENGIASTAASKNPHSKNTNANDWALDADGSEGQPDPEKSQTAQNKEASETESEGESSADEEGGEEPFEAPMANNLVEDDEPLAEDGDSLKEKAAEEEADSTDERASEEKQADDSEESDDAEESEGEESEFDQTAGIWFGYGDDGTYSIEPDDSLGALPYDTYTIRELSCKANEGLQLVSASVVISSESEVVNLGSVNDPKASIATTACSQNDQGKTLSLGYEVGIIDKVSYANLIPGNSYTLTGSLMNAETGKAIEDESGNAITSSHAFTPEEPDGEIDLPFQISTEDLAGATIVVFETMECDKRTIASHEDLEDVGQSVHVVTPEIGTVASNADGDSQIVNADMRTVVRDVVSYTNLIPGYTYTLESSLVKSASGDPFEINGEPVVATSSFTPEQSSGTTEAIFEFDAIGLEDDLALVAFERVVSEKGLVASHEDPNDPGQTIRLVQPEIRTTLSNTADESKTIPAYASVSLTDTVSYTGLTPGREYVVSGELMDKETEKAIVDSQGNAIRASSSFTAETSQGTAQVVFEFDAPSLAGRSVVAFETLASEEREIAVHANIDDESQTFIFSEPHVKTSAQDAADQDKSITSGTIAKITDSISLSGLIPGREYTVMGVVMDKSTGLPLIQGIQQPASDDNQKDKDQEDERSATTQDGTKIETKAVSKKELASLWEEILASAELKPSGSQDGELVAFEQSTPFDQEKAKAVLDAHPDIASRIATQTKSFDAKEESEVVDMDFEVNANGILGQTVVFEALVDNETGTIVALHANIDDEDQTIEVVPPATDLPPSESRTVSNIKGSGYDKTGNMLSQYAWVPVLIIACGCIAATIALSQQQSARKRKEAIRMASLFGRDDQ